MFFYSVVYEGGTRLVGTNSFFNPWLSFVTEKYLDLPHKKSYSQRQAIGYKYVPQNYRIGTFDLSQFKVGQVYDLALGGPPIIVKSAELLCKEASSESAAIWLRKRLQKEEFRSEKWWLFRSLSSGLLYVRVNQENVLSEVCKIIKPAYFVSAEGQ